MSGTVSIDDEGDPQLRAFEARPTLFVALLGGTPLASPSRHTLANIDRISIGRGETRSSRHTGTRELALGIDDAAMSAQHALVRRTRASDGWVLEDLGSKNGTILRGERLAEARPLADGDMFLLGHTVFLFRAGSPTDVDLPDDLAAEGLSPPTPLLSTFLAPLARTFNVLRVVASADVPVIVGGESGTGKELVAHATHALSGRTGRVIAVNCGAIPAALVESELFGHRRGAFSGATEDRPGLVRAASGGTLFLDEIGDLPLPAQVALLRTLQEREVTPVGGTQPVKVDFRLVSATHTDLRTAAADGRFRADLLARLTGIVVDLPPLRSRREDLGIIVSTLLVRIGGRRAGGVRFGVSGLRFLFEHPFGANVRELEHLLTTASLLAGAAPITGDHFRTVVDNQDRVLGGGPAPQPRRSDNRQADRDDALLRSKLVTLFREHDGNVSAVARVLGKARFQVQRWMHRFQIDPADPR